MIMNTAIFPLHSPLIHCITNTVTSESVANSLLYIGAKPIMAEDVREFDELFQQTQGLLLNLGQISAEKDEIFLAAAQRAQARSLPWTIDLVGVSATSLRKNLATKITSYQPNVVKGNLSEMRAFCGLKSHGKGVDASFEDQQQQAKRELLLALQNLAASNPHTTYLATGEVDLVVSQKAAYELRNGVPALDCFTGTGDIVGALIAALLAEDYTAEEACLLAVSYFNICGEKAQAKASGLADFRQETLNHLSLLWETDWQKQIKKDKL